MATQDGTRNRRYLKLRKTLTPVSGFLLLGLLWSIAGWSDDRGCMQALSEIDTPHLHARIKLDPPSYFKDNNLGWLKITPSYPDRAVDADEHSRLVYARDSAGNTYGFLKHKIEPKTPRRLMIELVQVADQLRNKGVSEAMFAAVLNENPEIQEIEATFGGTNESFIRGHLSCGEKNAFATAPTVKMGLKFGFQIRSIVCEPHAYGGSGKFEVILAR